MPQHRFAPSGYAANCREEQCTRDGRVQGSVDLTPRNLLVGPNVESIGVRDPKGRQLEVLANEVEFACNHSKPIND